MARYSAGHVFPCACHSCVSYPRCDIIGVLETYRLRQLEQCAGQLPFWVLCEWFARNCSNVASCRYRLKTDSMKPETGAFNGKRGPLALIVSGTNTSKSPQGGTSDTFVTTISIARPTT